MKRDRINIILDGYRKYGDIIKARKSLRRWLMCLVETKLKAETSMGTCLNINNLGIIYDVAYKYPIKPRKYRMIPKDKLKEIRNRVSNEKF